MRQQLITVAAVLTCLVVSVWFYTTRSDGQENAESVTQIQNAHAEDNRGDDARLAALERRMSQLQNNVQGSAHQSQPASEEPAAEESEPLDPAEMTEAEREVYQARRVQERAIYRSQVNDVIDTESIDVEWAPEAEDTLQSSVGASQLEGLQVHELECRSTLCRVELGFPTSVDANEVIGELSVAPGFDMQGMADLEFEYDGTPRLYIFLAREGADFPNKEASGV